MRFQYRKIRSTAAAALLSSLASLALAPGLLFDADRVGAVLVKLAPEPLTAPKPLAPAIPAIEEAKVVAPHVAGRAKDVPEIEAFSAPAGDHVAAIDDFSPASVSGNSPPLRAGFFAIGSGWRTQGNTSRGGAGEFPATTAAIKQTFVPNDRGDEANTPATPTNNSPLQIADDESSDASPDDTTADEESGPTTDETDFADAGEHDNFNNDSAEHPRVPVATVPEPSSLALLSVGIIGLLICRHRSAS